MISLVVGLVLFLGVHSVSIVNSAWRDAMVARYGRGFWQAAYSLAAAAGLGMIIVGFGMARQEPTVLYVPPPWVRLPALALLVPVFPLLLAAYLPGRIRTALKHPMLVAVKLWALVHLALNGTVADVLLFGSILIWAVADRISLKRRAPRAVPALPARPANDAVAVILGLAIYAAFVFGLHRWLTGLPVWPGIG